MAENKENAQPGGGAVRYEMRKDGVVCCASYLPLCGYDLLTKAGRKRGFLMRGAEVDTERMARILLDEFRGGKLGRFTLELPEQAVKTADEAEEA